jgi:hypothetical protein
MKYLAMLVGAMMFAGCVHAQGPSMDNKDDTVVGTPGSDELIVVESGTSQAVIVVSPAAGKNETLAATDLGKYSQLMSGAKLAIADARVTCASCTTTSNR